MFCCVWYLMYSYIRYSHVWPYLSSMYDTVQGEQNCSVHLGFILLMWFILSAGLTILAVNFYTRIISYVEDWKKTHVCFVLHYCRGLAGRSYSLICNRLREITREGKSTGARGVCSILRAALHVRWRRRILHTGGLISHLLLPHFDFSRRHFL